ncbi:MAG: fumarylacetoacetate hydrolase family protein [Alphaproteobacteria bacterium]|nr:fumarylacetoacetate hydrolase family protein [Alphaproteobacteria bacterium]
MRLLRYGEVGAEKPGLLDADGKIRDLSGHIDDLTPNKLSSASLASLAAIDPTSLPVVDCAPRLGVPIAFVPNLLCIGLNYADHAAETGSPIPDQPILFMKHTGSIIGPNDPVRLPNGSTQSDWEVEFAAVIGERCANVSKADALNYVAGYTIVNDVSERHVQMNGGGRQWVKGKSPETFAPIGPWLVTKDEIADPHDLRLWLEVDGHMYQDSSTKQFIFDLPTVISHLSENLTMLPGDVISTGTPPGVGLGIKPEPVFLKAGQVMRLGIDGLGEQRQMVLPAPG